ncbi:MAG: FkbM family methyltransferase [Acetobacterales bacterium]
MRNFYRTYRGYPAHLAKAVLRQHHKGMLPLLRPWLPPDGIAVDVGAHAGQFTKLFAAAMPDGHIFAFEPGAYARAVLRPMLWLRRVRNVTVIPAGLSDRSGQMTLNVPVKPKGNPGFGLSYLSVADHESTCQTTRQGVPLTTLDDFVAQRGLARLDLVKADIEGWEAHLLRGARTTLARFAPALLLEVNLEHLRRAGSQPAEVWEPLARLGYRAQRVDGETTAVAVDGLAGPGDYLFIPPS